MAVMKRGQEKRVSFSDNEIDTIVSVLRKHLARQMKLEKLKKLWLCVPKNSVPENSHC